MKDPVFTGAGQSPFAVTRARVTTIFHVIWGQIIVAIAAFAGIRLYTEWLDHAQFGQAMLVMGIVALIDGLMGMAFNQTLLSRCAQIDNHETRRQLAVGLALLAGTSVGVFCVITSAGLTLAAFLGFSPLIFSAAPLVLLIYLGSEFLKYSLLSLLIVERDYRRFSTWLAGESLLALLCTGLLLTIWKADAEAYVLAYVGARLLSTAGFIAWFSRGRHLLAIDLSIARREVRTALHYGVPVSLMAPLGWVTTYLDRYILGAMLGVASTGAYVAATGLVTRPYALTTSVLSNYFRPQLYRQASATPTASVANSVSWRRRTMWKWIIAALVVGGGGAVAFLVLGGLIVRIMLAADYRQGALPLMAIFAVAQTLAIMTHGADNTLLATGRSGTLLKLQAGLSLATLTLIPLGIMWGGMMGAVVARCAAEAVKFSGTALLAAFVLGRASDLHSASEIERLSDPGVGA